VGISQRRACRALDQPRGTQRYPRKAKADEVALLKAIEAWVCRHPCYGYRMIHALLVADGFKVGRDRVYRLWRGHGYGVKQKPGKKRRLGVSANGIMRRQAESVNDVWCWDFIHDRDERGRVLRWLIIEDEFTREGLAVEVRRSFKARDVLDVLSELTLIRGVPGHIRSDNLPGAGPSGSPKWSAIFSSRPAWRRCTSNPVPRGRTRTPRASTAGSVPSC
jgi:hypothetical protein